MSLSYIHILAVVSIGCFILASPPYVIDTVRGRTKPERATWFIWSILGITAFISQATLGATWSLLFTGLDTFGSICVFFLSLRYGVGGWTRPDKVALCIAAVGVALSFVTHLPVLAICGVILADLSGTILTILKTFQSPDSETTISWILIGTGALCGVLSVRSLNVGLLLYPVYLTCANFSIVGAQVFGRITKRRSATA